MISPDDLQKIKLVDFSGGITYDSNGFAVLPDYEIKDILASVQPLTSSDIKFFPEGTHYADFINILTDYNVDVDNSPSNLGDYFIYGNNVYKIFSAQNYKDFTTYETAHINTTVARDNRIAYDPDDNTINIPFPQVDDAFAPLFELIAFCANCFDEDNAIPVLWAYQQELRPNFPYATANILGVRNLENIPYKKTDINTSTQYTSRSTVLSVNYRFYSYDKTQCHTLAGIFKLGFMDYEFTSDQIAFGGFEQVEENISEVLYENRSIFYSDVTVNFNFRIVREKESTQTIETAAATLSYSQ